MSNDPYSTRLPSSGETPEGRDPVASGWQQANAGVGQTPAPRLPEVQGYEVLGVLGRGGMGVVYKARQAGLNRVVALKMILAGTHASDEELLRFKIEAEAVAALQHPNIVAVHEIGELEGQHFFSMDYVAGRTLAEREACNASTRSTRALPANGDDATSFSRCAPPAFEGRGSATLTGAGARGGSGSGGGGGGRVSIGRGSTRMAPRGAGAPTGGAGGRGSSSIGPPGASFSDGLYAAPRPYRAAPFATFVDERQGTFVVPGDVLHLLPNVLDPYFFNIDYLVANGLTDDRMPVIGAIVDYESASAVGGLWDPSVFPSTDLSTIHSQAVSIPKDRATSFGRVFWNLDRAGLPYLFIGGIASSVWGRQRWTDDIDLFVFHQANLRINEYVANQLGIPPEKCISNIERYGNTTAATIPLALNDAVRDGRLKKGDRVLLASVGAGFTVGAMLIRWGI